MESNKEKYHTFSILLCSLKNSTCIRHDDDRETLSLNFFHVDKRKRELVYLQQCCLHRTTIYSCSFCKQVVESENERKKSRETMASSLKREEFIINVRKANSLL